MLPIGCVDALIETCISGWVADQADLQAQLSVDVFVDARLVATVRGDRYREDLRLAGIGDGRKSFVFDPGPYLKPGRNHVEVRYAGSDALVERGTGRLFRAVSEGLSSSEDAFHAALQAYCDEGTAPLVVRNFPGTAGALKDLIRRMGERGCLAGEFSRGDHAAPEIRRVFRECGIARVSFDSILSGPHGERRLFAFAQRGAGEAGPAEDLPLLAHIHVPKCAGTSFRMLLERYFGPRHMRLYIDDTYFVYGEDTLRHILLSDPPRALSSHHVRSFPRWLAGREMLYVTFLRDPIEQFVSYMTHIRKHYAGLTSQSLLASVPPDAPRLTLREFARWLLTQERDIPFRENHNVNFFARHSAPLAAGRLQAAKAALAGFFFVGIAGRMEESVCRLRTLAQSIGLDFPPDPISVENTSGEYRDDLAWIHPGDEVGAMLLRSVAEDRQLYDWAVARLEAPRAPRVAHPLS